MRKPAMRPAPKRFIRALQETRGAPAPLKKVDETPEFFEDIEQGTDEWFKLRLGIPTASVFGVVMADGKDGEASETRYDLMCMLAGELMTGVPAEGKIVTAAMQRGKDMEPEAIDHYENRHFDVELRKVGFIRRKLPSGRYVGCSPDRLIGQKRALEIKTMAPRLMIRRLDKGAGIPSQHRAQVQGTMWIADLEEVDLMLFYRGMPVAPKFTCVRDEHYIGELKKAVEVFDWELKQLVDKIRRMA